MRVAIIGTGDVGWALAAKLAQNINIQVDDITILAQLLTGLPTNQVFGFESTESILHGDLK